jgi:acetyl-CoA C-acetyltransferase
MTGVVIVDAVRSPFGRRGKAFASTAPVDLLGQVLQALFQRSDVDPVLVEQVVGGCVSQNGDQAPHVVRYAWLAAGLPYPAGATTLDAQCGSGQQAVGIVAAQIASGAIDVGIGCGVEVMSRVPLGSSGSGSKDFLAHSDIDMPTQFEAAERIAARRGLTRDDLDAFGARSQQLAAAAWEAGRMDAEVVPTTVDVDGEPVTVSRDEGLRETTTEALAGLRPTFEGALHTAGTSSQISDGAAAVLLMSEARCEGLGLDPLARIVDQCLVGSDPYYYLDGPPDATERLLARQRIGIDDIDLFEVNEAFAAVPLSWASVCHPDPDRVNVNGGAIALGHPVGASGARLIATAAHELRRRAQSRALVAMCCGGAMASGTLLARD